MVDPSLRDTIARVAAEEGIDPAYALAVAERESSLNPNAGGTGSIKGLYQFTGANRRKYGLADNADPEAQTRAFAHFTKDLQGEMAQHLGRQPTPSETYLGHYWGGARASRVIGGNHGGYAPADVFSPQELAGNPNLRKHATVGDAAADITADMDKRQAMFAGKPSGSDGQTSDFAAFGQPADEAVSQTAASDDAGKRDMSKNPTTKSGGNIDFAAFGQPPASMQSVDLAQFGQPQPSSPA